MIKKWWFECGYARATREPPQLFPKGINLEHFWSHHVRGHLAACDRQDRLASGIGAAAK